MEQLLIAYRRKVGPRLINNMNMKERPNIHRYTGGYICITTAYNIYGDFSGYFKEFASVGYLHFKCRSQVRYNKMEMGWVSREKVVLVSQPGRLEGDRVLVNEREGTTAV